MHEPYPFFDGSHQAGGKELQSLPKSRQLALQFKAEDHPDAEMYTGGYGFEDLLGGEFGMSLDCRIWKSVHITAGSRWTRDKILKCPSNVIKEIKWES